jgi:eukaryotic-like serine/threonine-protein kinase
VVYAGSSDGTVYAFKTRDGSVLWSFNALLHPTVAAVVNGVVYVGSDDESRTNIPGHQYSYALNASDGHLLWRFSRGEHIGPVVDGIAYVVSDQAAADRTLYALNVSDGSVRWAAHGTLLGLCTVARGVVYEITTQIVGPNMDSHVTLHALDASTGKERWSFPKGGAPLEACIPGNGAIYLVSNEGQGGQPPDVVYALNTQDGSVRWRITLSTGAVSGVLLNNGVLYMGVTDQTMLALNADTGAPLWHVPLRVNGAPATAGEGLLALYNSRPLSANDWNIAVLNASDGSMRWHYSATADQYQVVTASAFIKGVLFATASAINHADSYVLAFTASTGVLQWSYDVGNHFPPLTFSSLVG